MKNLTTIDTMVFTIGTKGKIVPVVRSIVSIVVKDRGKK